MRLQIVSDRGTGEQSLCPAAQDPRIGFGRPRSCGALRWNEAGSDHDRITCAEASRVLRAGVASADRLLVRLRPDHQHRVWRGLVRGRACSADADAEVWGFDISPQVRYACAQAAAVNGVSIHIEATADPQTVQRLVGPGTLVIADAEGAEVDVLDPAVAPGLVSADILVERHDFLWPGAAEAMLRRFPDRPHTFIEQQPRSPADFPVLASLTAPDQQSALSEGRPFDQRWLWLPATVR